MSVCLNLTVSENISFKIIKNSSAQYCYPHPLYIEVIFEHEWCWLIFKLNLRLDASDLTESPSNNHKISPFPSDKDQTCTTIPGSVLPTRQVTIENCELQIVNKILKFCDFVGEYCRCVIVNTTVVHDLHLQLRIYLPSDKTSVQCSNFSTIF